MPLLAGGAGGVRANVKENWVWVESLSRDKAGEMGWGWATEPQHEVPGNGPEKAYLAPYCMMVASKEEDGGLQEDIIGDEEKIVELPENFGHIFLISHPSQCLL